MTLFLCGAGNSEGVRLALSVNAARQRWARIVLLDDDPAKLGSERLGVVVAGPLSELAGADRDHDEVVNLVTRTCDRRAAMQAKIAAYGVPPASLVHPSVETAGTVLAAGATVYQGATIGPEARVGAASVVFMGAVVGHESDVAEGCVIAANAVLNARVRLADRVYVGSNATIVPEVTVGAGATIGVGSAVLRDVPPGATALGVPAEILQTAFAAPAGAASLTPTATADDAELRQSVRYAWQQILRMDGIEDEANFFDLGGSSLLACHLAERVQDVTGREVRMIDIFRYPSVRALVEHLGRRPETGRALSAAVQRMEFRRQLHQRSSR